MAEQTLESPPAYDTKSAELQLPSVPIAEPGSASRNDAFKPSRQSHTIPAIPATSPPRLMDLERPVQHVDGSPASSDPTSVKVQPLNLPSAPTHLPGGVASASEHPDHAAPVRAASTSMEDPDDRMAAEALCGLGKADPAQVVNGYQTPLRYYPMSIEHTQPGISPQQMPEPLLSLLTSAHPWLGGTLNGSLSAYSSTKSFTPRFVQYGADLVENTVGTVGRVSGVEGSIRKYLESRDEGTRGRKEVQSPGEHSSHDRRKVSGASSVDTLPLYDENRSPAYEEQVANAGGSLQMAQRPHMLRSWSTQLMISTSGLGAALNEASLRSLKFCLSILSRANKHVRDLMEALKRVLDDYRQSASREAGLRRSPSEKNADAMDVDQPQRDNAAAEIIANRIRQLNQEIWNTFKTVVNTISKYTGGALPENASVIVRWQLMSVPQRWRRAASRSTPGQEANPEAPGDEPVSSANRMLAFAVEGLEMMDQVGGVVDSTIVSAERWLESMGRRKDEGAIRLPSDEQEQRTSGMNATGSGQ